MAKLFSEFLLEHQFSDKKRKSLAKEHKALPDGSFPIETVKDLKNAKRKWLN